MKKRLFILLVLCLVLTLSLRFAVAEEAQQTPTTESQNSFFDGLRQIGESIKNKPNEILAKEITFPERIETPARIIFGLKSEDKLNLQFFIILVCVLVFVLLIFHNIIQFIPSFTKSTSWIGALVPTFILSAIGAFRLITLFLLDFGNIFGVLEKWGPLKLGFGIILILIIYYITSIIMGIVKETIILGRAVSEGVKAGAQIAKLNAMAKVQEQTAEIQGDLDIA